MIADEVVDNAMNNTTHSIILSKQNRDNRKWENFEESARMVKAKAIIMSELKDENIFIDLRKLHFWFTRSALYSLSYQVCYSVYTRGDL